MVTARARLFQTKSRIVNLHCNPRVKVQRGALFQNDTEPTQEKALQYRYSCFLICSHIQEVTNGALFTPPKARGSVSLLSQHHVTRTPGVLKTLNILLTYYEPIVLVIMDVHSITKIKRLRNMYIALLKNENHVRLYMANQRVISTNNGI